MNVVRQNLASINATTQEAEQKQEQKQALLDEIKNGLRQVTPTLLLVTAATGFAFAVGSALGGAFTHKVLGSKSNGSSRRRWRRDARK